MCGAIAYTSRTSTLRTAHNDPAELVLMASGLHHCTAHTMQPTAPTCLILTAALLDPSPESRCARLQHAPAATIHSCTKPHQPSRHITSPALRTSPAVQPQYAATAATAPPAAPPGWPPSAAPPPPPPFWPRPSLRLPSCPPCRPRPHHPRPRRPRPRSPRR